MLVVRIETSKSLSPFSPHVYKSVCVRLLVLGAVLDEPDEGSIVKHPVRVDRCTSEHLVHLVISKPGGTGH